MKGWVYFIICHPMDAIKIGFTSSKPSARLRALQTGCPAPLRLYAYFPGTMDDEKRLHQAFNPLHIHGEWFRMEGKLSDLASSLGGADNRQTFIEVLHDHLMQGEGWHPRHEMDCDAYYETGDWEPFRKELWAAFGPWEE